MKRRYFNIFLLVSLLFVLNCSKNKPQSAQATHQDKHFDPGKSDPRAIQVVDQMWKALGVPDHWEKARYLSFHWIVEREGQTVADYRHDWDRYTNRYRVEGKNREGKHVVVFMNLETKQGQAYEDGQAVPTDSLSKYINFAYQRFINDSYWLLMPYKLKDPGVILHYEGEKEEKGQKYDVVKVTFENVGLTPGDTYWAFVNKQTHLMDKWEYLLQNRQPPPQVAWWKDWRDFNGIKLALDREFEGRPFHIYFKYVKVSSEVDEQIFNSDTGRFE